MQDIFNKFRDFKSFEVSFIDKAKDLHRLFCTIKLVESNRLILNANNQANNNITALPGDDLQLHIYTEEGVYSAKSRVLQVEHGLVNTEYVIEYPSNSRHSQRREYFRAELPVKFRMKVFRNNDVNNFFFIEGTCKNISGRGMSFFSNEPFNFSSTTEIELYFDDRKIQTLAELIYTQSVFVSGAHRFVTAFTFIHIPAKDIEFIIKQCFQYQLGPKRNYS